MASKSKQREPTLCWSCKNTNRFKCPWFNPDDPQPVPGWVAELRPVKGVKGDSYFVKECPKFEPDPEMQRVATSVRTPGYPGVTRKTRNWVARIYRRGKNYYLGHFATEEQAIAARIAAEEAIKRGEEPRALNRRNSE